MTAQLVLQLDDVEQDRKLWKDTLELIRGESAMIGTKKTERLFERTDTKQFSDGDLARMLAEHQRHEMKAKHLVQLIKHAPTNTILKHLCDERGLLVSEPPVMTPEQELRAIRACLNECGELGAAVLRKAGLR